VPQVPQLFVSVPVFVQVVGLHSVLGARQTTPQEPPAHTWLVGHAFPQVPQLAASVLVVVQALPQKV
jgi:hypothetical protein